MNVINEMLHYSCPSPRLKFSAPAKAALCQKIKGLPQHIPVWKISTKVLIAQHKFHQEEILPHGIVLGLALVVT